MADNQQQQQQQPPPKKQKVNNDNIIDSNHHQFTHICTKDNAPLFTQLPTGYSTKDIPMYDFRLRKGMRICVLEDHVEYRKVIVEEKIINDGEIQSNNNTTTAAATEHQSNDHDQQQQQQREEEEKENESKTRVLTGYIKAHHSGKDDSFYRRSNLHASSATGTTKQKLAIMDLAQYNAKTDTYQFSMESIGIFHSCFPEKNGTPRQGNLVPMSRGKVSLTIPQGHQAIDALTQFEFVWLIFVFHKNTPCSVERTKIRPPRMNGNERVGMYATRTPHRPNAIGLTMATIERIEKHELFLSGVDLVDGTPILDIKPVIPRYDCAPAINARVPEWIGEDKFVAKINRDNIVWSDESKDQLQQIVDSKKLKYYNSLDEIKEAIIEVLQTDPRPVYVRKKGMDKLYGFRIDVVNVRCSVSERDRIEIVEIELWED